MSTDRCTWYQGEEDADYWETSCNQIFVLNEDSPHANGMRFCCYCGKPLDEEPWEPEDEGEEEDE